MMFTADELVAALDPAAWDVVSAQTRPRAATAPQHRDGPAHHHDVVLNARRR